MERVKQSDLWTAIGKSVVGRYGSYAVSLITLTVLARVFSPEQFGVVALVQVFFTFAMMLAESGLGPAIINATKFSERDRDGVFTLTLGLGLVLGLGLWMSGTHIARFFGEGQVTEAVLPLSIALFFSAAVIVPLAHMNRSQRFIQIGLIDGVAEALSTAVACVLFFSHTLSPVQSLAARFAARAFFRWAGVMHGSAKTELGRPRLGDHLRGVTPLLSFSLYQFGFNFVNFFSRNLDNVLVGRLLGTASLGVYEKTYQLMKYPLTALTFAMAPAIQPVMRFSMSDPQHASTLHVRFATTLAYMGLVAGATMAMGAGTIVSVLLGPQWVAVTPVLQILGLGIPVQVVLSSSGGFFKAMGNTRMLFFSGLLSAAVMITAIAFGVQSRNLITLSWALVGAFHLNFVQSYFVLHRFVFRASSRPFFAAMLVPGLVIVVLVMVTANRLAEVALPS